LTQKVNLVIFKDGSDKNLEKAQKLNIDIVNIFWVEYCFARS